MHLESHRPSPKYFVLHYFLSQIGYCPQFDSIIPELTGRELLSLMARVRGVQLDRVGEEVDRWTTFLGIQEYIDR